MNSSYTLSHLANYIGGTLSSDISSCVRIKGIATLQEAGPTQLSFLAKSKYKKYLFSTRAAAIIMNAADAANYSGVSIIVSNPYLAYAKLSTLFYRKPKYIIGIHPTAIIAVDAIIDPTASIGAYTVIENNAHICANVIIGSHCFIGMRSIIGEGGWVAPRVTLYHDVTIGSNVIIQSGAVIGSEGFGFAKKNGKWEKIAQLGGVIIGNNVEIGANTTIDRGSLSNTIIGNGVKLDNNIMIAHNVQVGNHTAIAACVGISGSAKIGKHCMLAGGVGLVGHIEICDNVFITGMTMVTRSISTPGSYSSGTAMQPAYEWKKSAVRIRKLDDMIRRIKHIEKQISAAAVTSCAVSDD